MAKDKDTKDKHFPDQFDDEEVLFMFRKHPVVMRKGLVIACAAMLAGPVYTFILTYTRPDNLPSIGFFFGSIAASFVLAMILFFPSWIAWFYSVFIVTDQRLIQITQKGLFHRTVVDLALSQIQMVNYQINGLQETLLGFGTIMMQTYVGDLVIHDVHHPAEIQKKVLGILREKGITTTNFPANKDQADNGTEEDEE